MIGHFLIVWTILAFVTALILGRIIRSADERQQQSRKCEANGGRFGSHVNNHEGRNNP